MKKLYKILFIALAISGMFFAKTTQGQTAYVSLDTVVNNGTIKFCTSDYSQVVIYKPTTALTGTTWSIQNPSWYQLFTDSIVLYAINSGTIGFSSNETSSLLVFFYLVSPPVTPNLIDVNVCGDIFSTTFNAQNTDIGAAYLWSTGATTKNITVHQEGPYSVIVDNGCGIVYDTALIIGNHTNDADLGGNDTICLGSNITLTTGNSNISTYVWSTGVSTATITISTGGNYSVTTTDNSTCISVDTMNLTILTPYDQQELCMANFDTITQYNILSWYQHLGVGIDSVEILRSDTLGIWNPIGIVDNNQTSFVDVGSTPQSNSNSYKIVVVDGCGNRSAGSDPHTTITLLTSYNPGPNTMGFNWSHYLVNGLLVAPTYTIYGIDNMGGIHIIGTVSGSQNYYIWNSPDLSYVKFFIGFTLTCGTKTNYLVRSNYTGNPATGITEQSLANMIKIYPTLTDGPITIMTDLAIKEISVYNTLGQVLLVTKEKQFDIMYHGLCILYITTDKGVIEQKFIVR